MPLYSAHPILAWSHICDLNQVFRLSPVLIDRVWHVDIDPTYTSQKTGDWHEGFVMRHGQLVSSRLGCRPVIRISAGVVVEAHSGVSRESFAIACDSYMGSHNLRKIGPLTSLAAELL